MNETVKPTICEKNAWLWYKNLLTIGILKIMLIDIYILKQRYCYGDKHSFENNYLREDNEFYKKIKENFNFFYFFRILVKLNHKKKMYI